MSSVFVFVIEVQRCSVDDFGSVSAYQVYCAGFEGFGALGDGTHHQYRFAQRWSFFLDATAVGEYDVAACHHVYKG